MRPGSARLVIAALQKLQTAVSKRILTALSLASMTYRETNKCQRDATPGEEELKTANEKIAELCKHRGMQEPCCLTRLL